MAKKGKGAARRPGTPAPRAASNTTSSQTSRTAGKPSGASGPAARTPARAPASTATSVATASRPTTAKSSETTGAKRTISAGNDAGPAVRRAAPKTRAYRSRMSRYARRRRQQTQLVGGALLLIAVGALAFYVFHSLAANAGKSTAHTSSTTTASTACTTNAQTGLNGTPASAGGPAPVSGTLVTLPGCLQYIDAKVGTGQAVTASDTVSVDYTGWLINGTKFDASQPGQPVQFPLNQVIKGWSEGLVGMKVGGTRRLIIPPSLGYGAQGQGPIPANSTLIFDVTLEKIG